MSPSRRTALGLIAGAALGAADPVQAANGRERRSVVITARPLLAFEPRYADRRIFGGLTFRGGLELRSSDREFGGISGLWRDANGKQLVAISDAGSWLTAEVIQQNGRPTGLVNAEMAPVLNAAGRPLRKTRSFDTEGLAIAHGVAYVGIERTHDILRFDWASAGVSAPGKPVSVPAAVKKLPFNKGIEAIGVAPRGLVIAGAVVAISERSGRADEPTSGWIIGGAHAGHFQVRRKDGYDITDLAFLPGGDMLLLERWYQPWRGVAMRLRRVGGENIRSGALLDGDVLLEADMGFEIDNMEALCVHQEAGRTVVTLMSDDNFSFIQRTILLEFVLNT